jgi:hypothetical protein
MKLPDSIPHSLNCPYSWRHQQYHSKAELEWQKANPGSVVKTLVYYCHVCKNGFTTTESDTISLKHYNNKKRSLVRKDKIKKINEL